MKNILVNWIRSWTFFTCLNCDRVFLVTTALYKKNGKRKRRFSKATEPEKCTNCGYLKFKEDDERGLEEVRKKFQLGSER